MSDHARPEREIDTRPIRRLELIPRHEGTTAEEDRFETILWDPESPVWRISAPEEEVEELPELVGAAAPTASAAPDRLPVRASAPAQDPSGGEGPLFALGGLALVVVSVLLVVVVSFRGGTASPRSHPAPAPAALSTVAMPAETAARPAPVAARPSQVAALPEQEQPQAQPPAREKPSAPAGRTSRQRASILPVPAYPLATARLKGTQAGVDDPLVVDSSDPAPSTSAAPAVPAPRTVAENPAPAPRAAAAPHGAAAPAVRAPRTVAQSPAPAPQRAQAPRVASGTWIPPVAAPPAPGPGPGNRPDVVVTALQPSRSAAPAAVSSSRPGAPVARAARPASPRPAAPVARASQPRQAPARVASVDSALQPAAPRPRVAPPRRAPQATPTPRPAAAPRPSFTASLLAATGRTLRNPWLLVAPPRGEH